MGSSLDTAGAVSVARESHSLHHWLVLALGIVAISTGSILVRLAESPPLAVGAWRMLLATALLTPWAWPRLRRERTVLGRREWALLGLSGLALAMHLATWVTSLSYTTVASSVILVSTNPIFVGLASHYLLRERLRRRTVVAIAITLMGSAIVGYGDFGLSGKALWGDLLALIGAVTGSTYILLGRAVRRKLSTLAYVWPCYGIAGLILLALSAVSGQPLHGYDGQTWLVLILLALGPQITGHSVFNWALGHFSPIFVTLAILGEPVGATLLALLILGEAPPLTALAGGLLILLGIYMASRDEVSPDGCRSEVECTQDHLHS